MVAVFGEVGSDHLITSKYFGTILYTVDPGGYMAPSDLFFFIFFSH